MAPVDLDRVFTVAMGDEGFVFELIDIFLEDVPSQLEVLRQAVESHDGSAAVVAAHRLKGSTGNMGAESLSRLCQKLEQSSRRNCLQELPRLLDEAEEEFGRVREYLTAVKGDQGSGGTAPCRNSPSR